MTILEKLRNLYYGNPPEPEMSEYDKNVEDYRRNEFIGRKTARNICKSIFPYSIGEGDNVQWHVRVEKFRRLDA